MRLPERRGRSRTERGTYSPLVPSQPYLLKPQTDDSLRWQLIGDDYSDGASNYQLVIRKKCAPTFDGLGVSRRPLHPAGDGSLGYIKAQHEKLTVNARRAPGWVFRHQPEDQLSKFHG
jgi:hypothetical protein